MTSKTHRNSRKSAIWLAGASIALSLLQGCTQESTLQTEPNGTYPTEPNTREGKAGDFPPGTRFLAWDSDENGVNYIPVEIRGDVALIEGDIAIATGQAEINALQSVLVDPFSTSSLLGQSSLKKSTAFLDRNSLKNGEGHWLEGYICYEIDSEIRNDSEKLKLVQQAVTRWNTQADLPFVERSCTSFNAPYGVKFIWDRAYTYADIGRRISRLSVIHLNFRDIPTGEDGIGRIMHEMGHTAGYFHEHQRPDRDSYVQVAVVNVTDPNWQSTDAWIGNYAIIPSTVGKTLSGYDMASIMNYPSIRLDYATFSATVQKKGGESISTATNLSWTDLYGLNYLAWDTPFQMTKTSMKWSGKKTMVRMEFLIESQKYLFNYDAISGSTGWYEIDDQGGLTFKKDYILVKGCNSLEYFKMEGKYPALSCYNSKTGFHRVYTLAGKSSELTYQGDYFVGTQFDQIRFFKFGSTTFAYCQITNPSSGSYGKTVIIRLKNNGEVDVTPYANNRKDWNINVFFELESIVGFYPYLVSQNTSTGETRTYQIGSDGVPKFSTPKSIAYLEKSSEAVVTGQGQEAFFFSSQPEYKYMTVHRIKNDGTFHNSSYHCRRYTNPYGVYTQLAAVTDREGSTKFPNRKWSQRGFIGSERNDVAGMRVGLAYPYF
ncbi:MAG: M12 family metallopeptidase [Fibrobacterota bacterium]|nr:M12 family metallopeptidase [Fibrobacterota bacterium]